MTIREERMRGLLVAAAVGMAITAAAPAAAEHGAQLAVYAGSYDIAKTTAIEAGVEYRMHSRAFELVPVFGAAATDDSAFWVYSGLRRPFRVGRGWRLTPGFAIALYEEGTGKDLGGPVEFRSSLDLGYRFVGGSSLELGIHHLSNSGIYDDNPGSNSIILIWAIPIAGP